MTDGIHLLANSVQVSEHDNIRDKFKFALIYYTNSGIGSNLKHTSQDNETLNFSDFNRTRNRMVFSIN